MATVVEEQPETQIESSGILEIDTAALKDMLLLPGNYEVIGATCDLSRTRTISFLIRVSGEEISEEQSIAVPIYTRTEINEKQYISLEDIKWISGFQRPATDLISLPRWLISPYDRRLPWSARDTYRALLYKSMELGEETLTLAEGELQRLINIFPTVQIRSHLDRLRNGGYLRSWHTEGEKKERRWIITVNPPTAVPA